MGDHDNVMTGSATRHFELMEHLVMQVIIEKGGPCVIC